MNSSSVERSLEETPGSTVPAPPSVALLMAPEAWVYLVRFHLREQMRRRVGVEELLVWLTRKWGVSVSRRGGYKSAVSSIQVNRSCRLDEGDRWRAYRLSATSRRNISSVVMYRGAGTGDDLRTSFLRRCAIPVNRTIDLGAMRMKVGSLVIVLLASVPACSGNSSVDECVENLQRRHNQAANRAIREADAIGDTIEGALDVQKESGLDDDQIRLLRGAQERTRELASDLDSAFNVTCEQQL